jgi:error-prone DNA polymerase
MKQMVSETRVPIPAKPGREVRYDYQYERGGTANLFMMFAPLEGRRHVKVTDRHTAVDYAHVLRELSDTHFPHAEKIILVQDNLNTHKAASLYQAFPAAEARRLAERFEWHHTPRHGSWLNMAECELAVLSSQMGWTAPQRHQCAIVRVVETKQREPPTMSISMIGMDTAKAVFQVHGIDAGGKVQVRRKLRRDEVIPFFEKQPACTVVLEACGGGHHWARMLRALGHEAKLIAPEAARPFVKKGKKNDAADAAALCEAASRPEVKFVPVKSPEQQGVLALHSVRSLLVKQETMLANAMRGLGTEFGLTAPKGVQKLDDLRVQVLDDASVPATAKMAFDEMHDHRREKARHIEEIEARIVEHARHNETARRLATIPGIGPITASLISATVGDNIGAFKSARHFAAWLGLVPRQHSTGGKTRLGRITKAGNSEIRRLLVLGATSMAYRAGQWNSEVGAWLRGVLERRPARLATVALANKMARIAWAVMTRKEDYRARGRATAAAAAAAA